MKQKVHKIGLIRGGQIGQMMIQAALPYGVEISVLDHDPAASCAKWATHFVQGDALNKEDVVNFGRDLDAISLEIEHVNVDALRELKQQGVTILPDPEVLAIIQDKGLQKKFFQEHKIPTADFQLIDSRADLASFSDYPIVQKQRKQGYDGKGVQILHSSSDVVKAFDAPSVLEQKVDLKQEFSIIVARNQAGQVEFYPAVDLHFHEHGNLLDYLVMPSLLSADILSQAQQIVHDLATKLNYVGVMAVEFFLSTENEVLVNEIAPRPHNSGHQTIDCSISSQYDQQVRCLLGYPLGSTNMNGFCILMNVLGSAGCTGSAKFEGIEEVLALPEVKVFLYGKQETRPLRKMGHLTICSPDLNRAMEVLEICQEKVRVVA